MQKIPHVPVLYREVLEAFEGIGSGIIVDCTLGYGGHSSMLLEHLSEIELIGIDQDEAAIEFSSKRLENFQQRAKIKQGRFSEVFQDVLAHNEKKNIKGILADIGVSSLQLDKKERGFSYESDTLDMRMDQDANFSASDVVNSYAQDELERVLLEYGEIRNFKKIASVIANNRPFHSAKQLSEAVKPFMPKGKKIHPATLVMQAIRIEVNDELGELKSLLQSIEDAKLDGAKIAIITFHSLEDRIVKQKFVQWSKSCICPDGVMRCECGNNHSLGKIISRKPITAKDDELRENARSRSAKLRIFHMEAA